MADWSNPPPEVVGAILDHNAQILTPVYWAIITNTASTAMLVPLFIALFYFSTKSQRQSAIFVFVSLGVGAAILGAIFSNYVVVDAVMHPLKPVAPWSTMLIAILAVLPTFIVDIALFFRLVAVYPRVTTPRLMLAAILLFPIVLKMLRVGEWVLWVIAGTRHLFKLKVGYVQSDLQRRLTVARWVLTLVDNGYMTIMFLWKLRYSVKVEDHDVMSHQSLPNTLRQRIRTVFWLVLSNFVLPVPFFIAIVVLVIRDPNSTAYTLTGIVAGFVSVVSAVYATVWRGVSRYEHQSGNITLSLDDSGPPQFRRPLSLDHSRSFSEPDLASRIRRRRGHDSLSSPDTGTALDVLGTHWRESGDDPDVFKRIDKPSATSVHSPLPMHLRLNVDGVKSLP